MEEEQTKHVAQNSNIVGKIYSWNDFFKNKKLQKLGHFASGEGSGSVGKNPSLPVGVGSGAKVPYFQENSENSEILPPFPTPPAG